MLTYNPANWDWKDYENICNSTKKGIKIKEQWTCGSKQPLIGDEFYLIKIGDKPKGIIAHGIVTETTFESEHYNPQKATHGETIRRIGIEFDRVQNYKNESILPQEILKTRFPEQVWSPQKSGIKIKPEILDALNKMWIELLNNRKNKIYTSSLGDENSMRDLKVSDKPKRSTIVQAINDFFNQNLGGYQQAMWHKGIGNYKVWFVKSEYDKNGDLKQSSKSSCWYNEFNDDESVMLGFPPQVFEYDKHNQYIIIFAKTNEYNGYAFKGVFVEDTPNRNGRIHLYKRIGTEIRIDRTNTENIKVLDEIPVNNIPESKFNPLIEKYTEKLKEEHNKEILNKKEKFNFENNKKLIHKISSIPLLTNYLLEEDCMRLCVGEEFLYLVDSPNKSAICAVISKKKNSKYKEFDIPTQEKYDYRFTKFEKERDYIHNRNEFFGIARIFKDEDTLLKFINRFIDVSKHTIADNIIHKDSDEYIILDSEKDEEEIILTETYKKVVSELPSNPNKVIEINSKTYYRSSIVRTYAKERAKGICELCGKEAPFKVNGKPYLECHHIIPLSEGGTDDFNNVAGVCPNCHRKLHTLKLPEDIEILKNNILKKEL